MPERPRKKVVAITGALIVAALMSAALLLGDRADEGTAAANSQAAARPSSNGKKITLEDLEKLAWADLSRATKIFGTNSELRNAIIEPPTPFQNAPAKYLQGLVLVADNRPEAALLAFDALATSDVPALFLYAPYRLHGSLRAEQPNPYLAPLEEAIEKNQLPVLIQARVQAMEGRLEKALLSYARSRPDRWVNQDLASLERIRQHAGLRPDVDLLISGALRGGGISSEIRPALVALSRNTPADPEISTARMNELKKRLESDANLRRIATAATVRQLALRKQFIEKDYQQLLTDHRKTAPHSVPDETALLLLLSAASLADDEALDRWSLEVRRRYPSPEVRDWIQTLQPVAL